MRHGDDLEAERQHVWRKLGLDDLVGVDALFLAMGGALAQYALHGAQCLQVARHGQVIERNGHGKSSRKGEPSAGPRSISSATGLLWRCATAQATRRD